MRLVYKYRKGVNTFLQNLNYHWSDYINKRGWRTNEVVNGVLTRNGYSEGSGSIECLEDKHYIGVLISANVFMYMLKIKPIGND